MQLDRNQVSVISTNIAVLLAANTARVEMVSCPECETPCFADSAFGSFLCGYCGHGPFRAADELETNGERREGAEQDVEVEAVLRELRERLGDDWDRHHLPPGGAPYAYFPLF